VGNVFGPATEIGFTNPPTADNRPFGSPTNAGNGTQFGQSRVNTGVGKPHPNANFLTISKQPHVPPFTRNGSSSIEESPFGLNPVIQPHERNHLATRKIFGHFRTASGASRTLPSDTAFNRVPPKNRPHNPRPPQNYTLNLVRQKQVGPSFVSRGAMWMDPHQSLVMDHKNLNGITGKGRWNTVKKGAAG
jgi:hypothetical protein